MKRKTVKIDEWAKVVSEEKKHSSLYMQYMGLSPGGAASELNVSRQMIYMLVKKGTLDAIRIQDDNGSFIGTLITLESIKKYKNDRHSFGQFRKQQTKIDFEDTA